MKKQLILILLLLSSTVTIKAQTRTADEAAVRQTLGAFSNSWNKGDYSDMSTYMMPDSH